VRLLDGHGWKSGLRGRVRHKNLPRTAAKATPASFFVFFLLKHARVRTATGRGRSCRYGSDNVQNMARAR
jgi:hypothetical protein